jgi:hypothetical protein
MAFLYDISKNVIELNVLRKGGLESLSRRADDPF